MACPSGIRSIIKINRLFSQKCECTFPLFCYLDFGDTLNCLKNVAGSLSLCENQRLRALGYHRINFLRHRYFMLYRIEENTVFIDDIFHELQDYENKMK